MEVDQALNDESLSPNYVLHELHLDLMFWAKTLRFMCS